MILGRGDQGDCAGAFVFAETQLVTGATAQHARGRLAIFGGDLRAFVNRVVQAAENEWPARVAVFMADDDLVADLQRKVEAAIRPGPGVGDAHALDDRLAADRGFAGEGHFVEAGVFGGAGLVITIRRQVGVADHAQADARNARWLAQCGAQQGAGEGHAGERIAVHRIFARVGRSIAVFDPRQDPFRIVVRILVAADFQAKAGPDLMQIAGTAGLGGQRRGAFADPHRHFARGEGRLFLTVASEVLTCE